MKYPILLCLAIATTLPVVAADAPGSSNPLQGIWKPVEGTLSGQPLPPAMLEVITLKLAGDEYEVTIKGEQQDKGTSKVDTSVSPPRLSITSVDGPNRGKTFLAIYEIKDADTFRVCYDLSGKEYPTEFKSASGTEHYLVTYTRKKE